MSSAHLFTTKTANCSEHARRYLRGLTSTVSRKNIGRMDERLEERDYEGLQHFISGSPWRERPVYDFVAALANGRLGGRPDSMLIIDESAYAKKGSASVGVARQYNGRLGKQDNCQVGVFSVLHCGTHSAPTGARLFLPDSWVEDEARCLKAGVPQERIVARTKIELARELVEQALDQGLRFACVGIDAFYGRDQGFLQWMESRSLVYCADVPANTLVFASKPSAMQRPAKMTKAAERVDALALKWSQRGGQAVDLREGENGLVRVEAWARRVWVWPEEDATPHQCWLVVTRGGDGELKTALSNAPASTSCERLARWQRGRFFIERSFQDAKSHVGMAQYQARGWLAWHHHMAMVALAMYFIMEERLLLAPAAPLLSTGDVVELLDWYVAGPRSAAAVTAAIRARHRQRQRNALSAQNNPRKKYGLPRIRKMRCQSLPK